MIKKVLHSNSQNYFCTLAIGEKYVKNFKKYTFKNFKIYCKKNDIGLFVITKDLLDKKSNYWKKPEWQKLIAPKMLYSKFKNIKNICMIDTDILINTESPNIFNFHKSNTISVISIRKYMPYDWRETTRKMAFLRKKYYSKKYPLDSALNISIQNLYKFHNLSPQNDEFCAGVYIISKNNFNVLSDFFFKFDKNVKSITNGGEQTHFNYFIQKNLKLNILDYKFQAQWVFEMANYYPFLYSKKYNSSKLVKECVLNSLFNNFFLHFAGSWYESDLLFKSKLKESDYLSSSKYQLNKYLNKNIISTGAKRILPKK